VQLHVDGGEERRRAGIVAHQHHQLDQLVRSELRLHLRERFRAHLVVAKDLAAELDHRRVSLIQAVGRLAMLDHVDDAWLDAFLQRFRLVRAPLELAVHLARRGEDCDLAHARRETRLEA
jgi:hypothetical protein